MPITIILLSIPAEAFGATRSERLRIACEAFAHQLAPSCRIQQVEPSQWSFKFETPQHACAVQAYYNALHQGRGP
ncbi:MAG: hypothetical protein JWN34_2150 [Bryobacterales bacterium]|nr:hypothetical protein [Bryobacterales bacterium]